MKLKALILTFVLTMLSMSAGAQNAAWVGSWGASPLAPRAAGGPFPGSPSFEDRTIRQIVRLSAGGEALRLRLTNEYGTAPLTVGAARVALVDANGKLRAGTERVVTFSGQASVQIAAGAPFISDPVDLDVGELATLSISLYFPEDTGPCTCHGTAMQEGYVSAAGDHTAGNFEPAEMLQSRAFISGVEVLAAADGVVVTLGDSITDGVGSTPGANRRWPDLLAERLSATGNWGVVNHGISGNRVLSDGAGESALARFDRDVLSVPGATHLIVFEGVNDLGIAFGNFGGPGGGGPGGGGPRGGGPALPQGMTVTAATMIAGFRQIIARAHAAGLEVFGVTIAPYEGASYYADRGETAREAINTWIRESGEFDAVLDFDAVLRDPAHPAMIKDGLHAGDHLHGSDAGYRAVADSIDLSLF
jgi:lysophospholipase L1-like esterase